MVRVSFRDKVKKTKLKQYVGREYEIGKFSDRLNHFDYGINHILCYYGIGGIGKSKLSEQLQNIAKADSLCKYATINFETKERLKPINTLARIREELGTYHKVKFPLFDMAYILYIKKVDSKIVLNEKNMPFIEEGSLAFDIVSTMEGIPYLNLVPKFMDISKRFYDNATAQKYAEILQDFKELSASKMLENLPYILGEDITEHIEKNNSKFVFFFDTYEALWTDRKDLAFKNNADQWIRDFISSIEGALWIITGREKLIWDELKEDGWHGQIHNYLLGNLDETQTKNLLAFHNIVDAEIQDTIFNSANGYPFSTKIAIDIYERIISQQQVPQPEDFSNLVSAEKVVERLLRYLNHSEKQLLEYLSLTNTWSNPTFLAIVEKFRIPLNLEDHAELIKFSFIKPNEKNRFEMHRIMRECLMNRLPDEKYRNGRRFLFDFFKGQLTHEVIFSDFHLASSLMNASFYHGFDLVEKELLDSVEFIHWYRKVDDLFLQAGKNYLTVPLIQKLILFIEESNLATKNEYLPILIYDYAYILMWELLDYVEAEQEFIKALTIRLNVYGEMNLYTAKSYFGLATLYHRSGKINEAIELYEKSYEIRKKLTVDGDKLVVAFTGNGLGRLYQDLDMHEKAMPYYEESLEIRLNEHDIKYDKVYLAYLNLISCSQEMQQYEKAYDYCQQCIAIIEEHLPEKKMKYHRIKYYEAIILAQKGQLAAALTICQDALDYYKHWYGDKHVFYATLLHNIALLFKLNGQHQLAIEVMEQSIQIKSDGFIRLQSYQKSQKMLEYIKTSSTIDYRYCDFYF